MVHLAIYIYTAIPVLMMALTGGSATSVVIGTLIYTSLQFKFESKSLEDLSNMEYSDSSQMEQNTFSTLDRSIRVKISTTETQVYATDRESFQIPSTDPRLL